MTKLFREDAVKSILTMRRLTTGASVLLICIGVGVIVWHPWNPSISNIKKPLPIASSEPTIADQAYLKAKSGSLADAYALLDKSAASAKTPAEKQQFLLEKTILAYNRADYQSSLDFGIVAEDLKPSLSLSQILARAAGKLGKTELAIQYWNKAISQLDVDQNPSYLDEKASAEKAIKQLQAGTWQ